MDASMVKKCKVVIDKEKCTGCGLCKRDCVGNIIEQRIESRLI